MPFRRETALAIVLSIAFVFVAVGARAGIPGFSGDADAEPQNSLVQTQGASLLQSPLPTTPAYSEADHESWDDEEHESWDDDDDDGWDDDEHGDEDDDDEHDDSEDDDD